MSEKQPKRRRGAQPGNHNARKHGLYAAGVTQAEMEQYFQAMKNPAQNAATDLIYRRVSAMLGRNPDNVRGLREALKLLMRHYIASEHPGYEEEGKIREVFRTILETVREVELRDAAQRGADTGSAPQVTQRIGHETQGLTQRFGLETQNLTEQIEPENGFVPSPAQPIEPEDSFPAVLSGSETEQRQSRKTGTNGVNAPAAPGREAENSQAHEGTLLTCDLWF